MATEVEIKTSNGARFTCPPSAVYATVHDADEADAAINNVTLLYIGQLLSGGKYYIYRSTLEFDLSSIPAVATIQTAKLSVSVHDDTYLDIAWNLVVVDGSDLGSTIVVADYGDVRDETTSYGALATLGLVADNWYDLTLNADGIQAIQDALATGVVRFGLRSSRDISSTPPLEGSGNLERITLHNYDPATLVKLTLTYLVGLPTVTTDPATEVT